MSQQSLNSLAPEFMNNKYMDAPMNAMNAPMLNKAMSADDYKRYCHKIFDDVAGYFILVIAIQLPASYDIAERTARQELPAFSKGQLIDIALNEVELPVEIQCPPVAPAIDVEG